MTTVNSFNSPKNNHGAIKYWEQDLQSIRLTLNQSFGRSWIKLVRKIMESPDSLEAWTKNDSFPKGTVDLLENTSPYYLVFPTSEGGFAAGRRRGVAAAESRRPGFMCICSCRWATHLQDEAAKKKCPPRQILGTFFWDDFQSLTDFLVWWGPGR